METRRLEKQESVATMTPKTRTRLLSFLTLALAAAAVSQARAEPLSIGFVKMVDGAEVVAVARLAEDWPPPTSRFRENRGGRVKLELTSVLKGGLRPGKYDVCYDDLPWVGPDTEFIAFLGQNRCWRFAASPMAGAKVADAVLRVQGFYDFNGYFVTPGLVTLAQIETFLKERSLTYTIRGPLRFPKRGQPEWEASPVEIEVSYDARTGEATVRRLPELKGFPAHPAVTLGLFYADLVHLTYSDDGTMPLTVSGKIQPLVQDGVLKADFYVESPVVLTMEQFKAYAADTRKGESLYTISMTCVSPGGKPQMLTLSSHKAGYGRTLLGWPGGPLHPHVYGRTYSEGYVKIEVTAKLASGQELVLRFDGGEHESESRVTSDLPYLLAVRDLPGEVFVRDGQGEKLVATFTASLGDVHFATLEQPRALPQIGNSKGEAEADGTEHWTCPSQVSAIDQDRVLLWAGVVVALAATVLVAWRIRGRARRASSP
jgi:hypothetical protein